MAVVLKKEFRWEMGHRLPYHQEGCQNLHGHSYRAVVEVEGDPDSGGMVLDFGEISRVMRPLVAEMDHAFALDPNDHALRAFLVEHGLRRFELPCYSTAENLAMLLAGRLGEALRGRPNLRRLAVHLWETEKSSASYEVALTSE